MSEDPREYARWFADKVQECLSEQAIQVLLEREFKRLDDLGIQSPGLRKAVDTALENRRAYFAQEPL